MPAVQVETNGASTYATSITKSIGSSTKTEINDSFILKTQGEFTYEERPVIPLQTTRHVRVRVIATGLCGSDVSSSARETPKRPQR